MATNVNDVDDKTLPFDEEQKHWLKSAWSMAILRDALSPVIQEEFRVFHADVKSKHPPMCTKCTTKDLQFDRKFKTWSLKNPCSQCDPWVEEVTKQHTSKTDANVYKENTDVSKWLSSSWEVAKFFLPKGHKKDLGPEDCDSAGLLKMLSNCKFLDSKKDRKIIKASDEVITIRNQIFHSPDMKMKKNDMEKHIQDIIDFVPMILQDPSKAQDELRKVMVGEITPSNEKYLALEVEAIKQRLQDLVQRIDAKEEEKTDRADLASVLAYIENNEVLHEKLQTQVTQALDLILHLKDDMEDLKSRAEKGDSRLSQVEKELKQLQEVHSKLAQKETPSAGVNYKGQLQTYTQVNKFDAPKYYFKAHPLGGFACSVVVNDKEYSENTPHKRKVDGDQAAARIALIELGLLQGSECEDQSVDATPAVKSVRPAQDDASKSSINHGESPGIAMSTASDIDVELHINQLDDNKWQAKATVEIIGALQLPQTECETSKKAAEKAVALLALKKLQNNDVQSEAPQNDLYAFCGKNKHSKPSYITGFADDKKFTSIVICSGLTELQTIHFSGDVVSEENEARCSVRNKIEEFLEQLPCAGKSRERETVNGKLLESNTKSSKNHPRKQQSNEEKQNSKTLVVQHGSSSSQSNTNIPPNQDGATGGTAELTKAEKTISGKGQTAETPAEDYVSQLNLFCQKNQKRFNKLTFVFEEQEVDKKKRFKAISSVKVDLRNLEEDPPKEYQSKKEAEKQLALYVMKTFFPDIATDLSKAKNDLQETTVKHVKAQPTYNTPDKQGSFHSTCNIGEMEYKAESAEYFSDKASAKQDASKTLLKKIKS